MFIYNDFKTSVDFKNDFTNGKIHFFLIDLQKYQKGDCVFFFCDIDNTDCISPSIKGINS